MRAALLLLGMLLAVLAGPAHAGEAEEPAPIVLREGALFVPPWVARAGDDPGWAAPELDEAAWIPLKHPARWGLEPQLRGEPVVWYRAHLRVRPPEGQEQAGLAVVTNGAAEIYVGGRLIGRNGVIGSRPGWLWTGAPLVVPRDAIGPEGEIDLAVRVWMPSSWWPEGGGAFAVSIADAPMVGLWARGRLLELRSESLIGAIEVALSGLAGLAHLVLYRRRRDLRAHLWFGLAAVAQSAWLLQQVSLWHGWLRPYPGYWLGLSVAQGAFFAALTVFCASFFRTPLRAARVLAVWIFAATLLRPFVFVTWTDHVGWFDATFVLPGVLHALWALWLGVRARVVGARTVGIGIAGFLVWPVLFFAESLQLLPPGIDLTLLRAACNLWLTAGMVLGLAEQFGSSMDELERTYRAARWFVPVEFLERLGRTKIGEVRRGDVAKLEMSMLFFDIRGFSTLAEKHAPERTFALVNALFDHLEPHIRSNRGFVIQFTGDGFLALFPDADGAVQSALDQQAALARFGHELLDGKPLRAGMGIHTGPMTLGTIGGADQLLAGVVGDAANLASRIEGMTKMYGVSVLISESTRAALVHPERFTVRELDRVVAKGRNEPIGVCEVGGSAPEPFRPAYEHYRSGRFGEALAGFEACSGDGPAAVLAERCRRLLASPPGAWDGVWRLDTK